MSILTNYYQHAGSYPQVIHNATDNPRNHNSLPDHDLRIPTILLVKGLDSLPSPCYNIRMSKSNSNTANTTRTTNRTRKGPKPIQTVAQLKENLLRDALAKEIKKIDRKLNAAQRKRAAANARANDATRAIDSLMRIRAEFLAESGLAPKA